MDLYYDCQGGPHLQPRAVLLAPLILELKAQVSLISNLQRATVKSQSNAFIFIIEHIFSWFYSFREPEHRYYMKLDKSNKICPEETSMTV
jgi:hypothetical protein